MPPALVQRSAGAAPRVLFGSWEEVAEALELRIGVTRRRHLPGRQEVTFVKFREGGVHPLGQIDLFIHDSLHSERNVRFELDRAWAALRPNGALVVDDVDANWGFRSFTQTFSGHQSMICEAEPLHPDLRRFNEQGVIRNYSEAADYTCLDLDLKNPTSCWS